MAVFLITPLAHNFGAISAAVRSHFSEQDRHELQNQVGWLVSHSGTSVDVSHILGITAPSQGFKSEVGSAMVTSVASYYGLGSTVMWEWLKNKFEAL